MENKSNNSGQTCIICEKRVGVGLIDEVCQCPERQGDGSWKSEERICQNPKCGRKIKSGKFCNNAHCKFQQDKPCKTFTEDCYNHPQCMKSLEDER